ncbi:phosphate ABC transporter substrate-binding protein [Lacimicrobium sp. SS2-24]|uniref:phosphate ABC transporter substrate-binding protein n=1 Tax=Lacimicrobium sp. SS2-24 TaxID=2005569 RepID=UPI000B4AD8B8|nr:phosphate ABC transporter substrate-binding protein [Lacimicrobium sp. SS2-24]
MKQLKRVSGFALMFLSFSVFAEIAVIVHPSNTDTLSQEEIQRVFLAKTKTFPSGEQAVPIDFDDSVAVKNDFIGQVLNRNSSQIKAYWAKLVFTGKAQPPKTVASDDEMLKLIAANPNMIGYIDASKVSPDVRVVGTF